MAVYKKYRRVSNRYARRGRSGYSMYKLYRSRSSGAQARQIYGLNKKLKAIQRRTKPEINIAPLVEGNMTSDTGGLVINGVRIFNPIVLTNLLPEGSTASSDNAVIQGRFARLQNITMKGVFCYNIAGTGDSAPYNVSDLQRMMAFLRVVIVQTKSSRPSDISYTDVFTLDNAGTVPSGETPTSLGSFATIRAPLKLGLARVAKVVSDRTYSLSDTRQSVNIKTKLKYVKNWYRPLTESAAKGNVYMFVMMYDQTALFNPNVSSALFSYVSKCVYTDA